MNESCVSYLRTEMKCCGFMMISLIIIEWLFLSQAIKYHKQELTISKEVKDRSSEASTHGNLAVAYQALGAHEMALLHYRAHLNIARELKDTAGEACALLNLGNCLSSRAEFAQAVPYYENYLMLSQVYTKKYLKKTNFHNVLYSFYVCNSGGSVLCSTSSGLYIPKAQIQRFANFSSCNGGTVCTACYVTGILLGLVAHVLVWILLLTTFVDTIYYL